MNKSLQRTQFLASSRPHILMITNHGTHTWDVRAGLTDTGGQNQYVRDLSDTLVALGFRVTTYNRGGYADPVSNEPLTGERYKDNFSRIVYLEGGGNKFIRKEDLNREILEEEAAFAKGLIEKERLPIDLVISHYWDGALLGEILKKTAKIKTKHVWVPHSLGALKRDNFKDKPPEVVKPLRFEERIAYEQEVLPHIDAVASTSGDITHWLEKFHKRKPELFLPPSINTEMIHPLDPSVSREGIYEFLAETDPQTGKNLKKKDIVLEMSRTDVTKRKDIVVQAFAAALKKNPDAVLLLRIDRKKEEIFKQIDGLVKSAGIRDNVVYVGMVPSELMSQLYAIATVYISPSEMEGFGMSVQEAAATRHATISSNLIPFAVEYLAREGKDETIKSENGAVTIRWGKGGVIVPAGKSSGFAFALETLLRDQTKRNEMAKAAYDITIPYFTWENMTLRLLDKMEVRKMNDERFRPWGFYDVLADCPDHKAKRITVYPGKRLSLQRHQRRAEHWYVIHGEAVVTLDDKEVPVRTGQAIDIPRKAAHRIKNPGQTDLVFIEVQTGDYFGEDDIERLEDDFGRV